MNQEGGQEVCPIFIRFENRHRRTVGFQSPDDFLESGVAAFSQVQLLQELTDPAVAVAAAGYPVGFQSLNADGTISTRMAKNLDSVRQNTNLDRLPNIVALVIHRVGQCFLDGNIGNS